MNKLTQKLLTTGISLAGGFVGAKIVEATWRGVTGEEPPKNLDDTHTSVVRLVTFATISAGISALIQVASQRGAAKAVAHFSNTPAQQLGSEEV